jgi:1,2-diacylglycerol 3-beta-galactosyltransferase
MSGQTNVRPVRLLVLFADTGGGHRSAAEALAETWRAEHPSRVQFQLVDLFRCYSPFPFNSFGPSYPWMIRYFSAAYGGVFRATNGPRRVRALAAVCYRYVRPYLFRLLSEHPADGIVSVHPLFNHCVNRALGELRLGVPYITVVTDLWTGHAAWFDPHVSRLIVPDGRTRARAVACGVDPGQVSVHGLPVARQFTAGRPPARERASLRARLGLRPEGWVVVLMGGGEGMGPIERLAHALDATLPSDDPPPQVVVIAGRNAALRARLRAGRWRHPFRAEGFVNNLFEWLAAADVLLTKAGPGTITEALLSGLPVVLVSKVPGQEDGNVAFVTGEQVGFWEPHPGRAADRVRALLEPCNPALAAMADRAGRLARPGATSAIAAEILGLAARSAEGQPAVGQLRGAARGGNESHARYAVPRGVRCFPGLRGQCI